MDVKRALISTLAVLAMLAAVPGSASSKPNKKSRPAYVCRDKKDQGRPLSIPAIDGRAATGHYSVPAGEPQGLVVFGHGYGHTSLSWVEHMREASRRGLIAVTMDYRGLRIFPDDNGDGLPHSRGWNAMAGSEDLILAAQLFQSLCRIETVTILGVSMGANMTGLAVAMTGERELTKADGAPLFDYWVDVEGSVNLIETYLAARAAAPVIAFAKNAQEDIEAETGGTFEQKPGEYLKRTVIARVDDLEASGIRGAIVIHGADDGLVPPNQSRELTTLMREAGITTEMISIGRRDEDSEQETTITGHAIGAVYKPWVSPFAGHASEKSTTHIVMQTALDRLWALMVDAPPVDRECVVNGQAPGPLARSCTG